MSVLIFLLKTFHFFNYKNVQLMTTNVAGVGDVGKTKSLNQTDSIQIQWKTAKQKLKKGLVSLRLE